MCGDPPKKTYQKLQLLKLLTYYSPFKYPTETKLTLSEKSTIKLQFLNLLAHYLTFK